MPMRPTLYLLLLLQGSAAANTKGCDAEGSCGMGGAEAQSPMGAALLQVGRHMTSDEPETTISMSDVDDTEFLEKVQSWENKIEQSATAVKEDKTMALTKTIQDLVARIGGRIVSTSGLKSFEASLQEVPPTNKILLDLRNIASTSDGWLKLPPPEQGPVLWSMIRSDPWNCDLIPEGDRRHLTCGLAPGDKSLSPLQIRCSETDNDSCGIEHANSFRTLSNIGSLPCCMHSPFCAAPRCAVLEQVPQDPPRCTKRKAEENVAYMKDPDAWPGYHGWGGAFELDTLKFMDALACRKGKDCPDKLFDLALDLGANTGYYTEKLTVRNFAKNYIMVEANPNTANGYLHQRWGNDEWKQAWFTQQLQNKEGSQMPEFEIFNKPLSNHSHGVLDMCLTEGSMGDTAEGCQVPIASIDDLIPGNLSSTFQEHFEKATSAFVKIDTEGMDELVLRGMKNLLNETRGKYKDESPLYLVNFLQFEFSPLLMQIAKEREGFREYDIKTVTKFLESLGFESFMMGPRYLPLSHGSWNDDFKTWTDDPGNNAGTRLNYPSFRSTICPWCKDMDDKPSFTSDIFAIRSSHPRAAEIKLALGACEESKDFDIHDPQYSFSQESV